MKHQIKSSRGRKRSSKPATRNNSIKQPRWEIRQLWERHGAPLYRKSREALQGVTTRIVGHVNNLPKIEIKSDQWSLPTMVNGNKKMIAAGASALLFFSVGIFSLAQINDGEKAAVIEATVNNVIETSSVETTPFIPDDAVAINMAQLSKIMAVEKPLEIGITVYALTVDGRYVGTFEEEEQCETILAQVVETYSDDPDAKLETASFKEAVNIEKQQRFVGSFKSFDNPESVAQLILKGTNQEKKHKVQPGDSLWSIAETNQVNVDDLVRANPKINPDKLKIDQEISLIVPKPLITVVTKEIKEYALEIPFEVTYEDNSSIYKGESSVKKAGVKGEKLVQAEIIKENGVETNRVILKEEIKSQPSTKIVYKGTKDPPPRIGTGSFIRPSRGGKITSKFGTRWGRMHTGIDIGMPTGTAILASDGGIVTYAATKDAYGLCVIIDHGGTYSTLYGHNSKLLVKKGDKVFQGQVIAKSGNTGRSTGPHLHFEVRVNGVPINPTKKVKF